MDGPQPGKVPFGDEQEEQVEKSGRLQNSAPAFLVDGWYSGKLKPLQQNSFLLCMALNIVNYF